MSAQAEAKDYPSATEILTGAGAKLGQACAVRAPEKGLIVRRGILPPPYRFSLELSFIAKRKRPLQ